MANAEQEIRAVIDERIEAVGSKDPVPLAARQSDQIVTFDVLPPLRSTGRGVAERRTRDWFDGYDSDIG